MAAPKIRLDLAKRLRQLRTKFHFTQEEVAEKADLDFRYYQRLESRTPPAVKIDTIKRLAIAFKVEPSALLRK